MSQIAAPWTAEQVEALNHWQQASIFHPFTCGLDTRHGPLRATPGGWVCRRRSCSYIQEWAHDFMLTTAVLEELGWEAPERSAEP